MKKKWSKNVIHMCDKTFGSTNNLYMHVRRFHNSKKIYNCDYCKVTYKRVDSYYDHLATHKDKALQS